MRSALLDLREVVGCHPRKFYRVKNVKRIASSVNRIVPDYGQGGGFMGLVFIR